MAICHSNCTAAILILIVLILFYFNYTDAILIVLQWDSNLRLHCIVISCLLLLVLINETYLKHSQPLDYGTDTTIEVYFLIMSSYYGLGKI